MTRRRRRARRRRPARADRRWLAWGGAALAVSALAIGAVAVWSGGNDGPARAVSTPTRPPATTTTSTTTTTTTTTTLPPAPEPEPEPEVVAAPPPAPEPAPSGGIRWRTYTYAVVTDGVVNGSVDDVRSYARAVAQDDRGWRAAGIELVEVSDGADFLILLTNPGEVPKYSPGVCDTFYSCQSGSSVVINDDRWTQGSPNWPGPLDQYRIMVLNHEIGHWLGRGHQGCGGAGQLAPVMQQQSIDLQGCVINPWPLDWEIDSLR